jgi:hypothetical protein
MPEVAAESKSMMCACSFFLLQCNHNNLLLECRRRPWRAPPLHLCSRGDAPTAQLMVPIRMGGSFSNTAVEMVLSRF